jgi:hypothetical protein
MDQLELLTRAAFLRQAAVLAAGGVAAAALPFSTFAADEVAAETVAVRIDPLRVAGTLPPRFLGFSFEAATLAARPDGSPSPFTAADGALVGFLRRLGPGVLRFGGNSVEFTFWNAPAPSGLERHTVTLSEADLHGLADLLDAADQNLILGVNLGHGSPDAAASEVAAARRVFGKRLIGIEVGNEPDLFHKNGLRPPEYDYAAYRAELATYLAAIDRAAPGTPIAAPAAATAYRTYGIPLASDPPPGVTLITQHDYTEGPGSSPKVTIDRMLTPRPKTQADFSALVAAARAHGLPVRMGEMNSVYSGGRPGVSDTFASALWILDYGLTLAHLGASGINLHGGGHGPYTPIAIPSDAGGDMSARPIFYGLLALAQMGSGDMLEITGLDGAPLPDRVGAYAVRSAADGMLHIALINTRPDSAIRFQVSGFRPTVPGSILRLTGPSLDATGGVLLGGSPVSAAGAWAPTTPVEHPDQMAAGSFNVVVPGPGAAIVSLKPQV